MVCRSTCLIILELALNKAPDPEIGARRKSICSELIAVDYGINAFVIDNVTVIRPVVVSINLAAVVTVGIRPANENL